jgi:hypothetical protein
LWIALEAFATWVLSFSDFYEADWRITRDKVPSVNAIRVAAGTKARQVNQIPNNSGAIGSMKPATHQDICQGN